MNESRPSPPALPNHSLERTGDAASEARENEDTRL